MSEKKQMVTATIQLKSNNEVVKTDKFPFDGLVNQLDADYSSFVFIDNVVIPKSEILTMKLKKVDN